MPVYYYLFIFCFCKNTTYSYVPGNNILFIGMYGPKGPCEEIFIKHMKQNNYQVSYIVRERGEYILLVKWGDDHIPGSPFKIEA